MSTALDRRRFLRSLAGVGAVSAAAGVMTGATTTPPKVRPVRLAGAPSYEKLNRLVLLESEGGKLDVALQSGYSYQTINQNQVFLRTYNKTAVGPTISVKPGDTLRIKLLNELPPPPDTPCVCPETSHAHMDDPPQGVNTTNLHVHGLHVSPSNNSDNVFVQVCPDGGSFDYEYQIPADHPAGTFWYHPHKHGSAAVQVANGMAGALIIRGAIDDFFAQQGIQDETLLFQQVPYSKKANGQYTSEWVDIVSSSIEPLNLINGQLKPTIAMEAGKVYRWRMIHGGISETIPFQILNGSKAMPYYRIAVDGITTGTVDEMTAAQMAPGYRFDVLVKLPAGTYQLVKPAVNAAGGLNLRKPETAQILAVLKVAAGPSDMPIPTAEQLKQFVPSLPAFGSGLPVRPVQLGFSDTGWQFCARKGFETTGDPVCEKYSPDNPVLTVLGTSEQWQIVNTDPYNAHPFHIHVNPFQVVNIEYDQAWVDYFRQKGYRLTKLNIDPKEFVWRDTMLIHPCQKVTFNTKYEDYDGTFVMHCHILRHEDEGMMRNVQILKTQSPDPPADVIPVAKPGRPTCHA